MHKIIQILKQGGTILYPTDTVWGIGCDATNPIAVQKIYAIKQRSDSKALIVLVKDELQLKRYVQAVPPAIPSILAKVQRPTTIIYPNAQHLANNVIAQDGSIAIRIPQHDFCQQLLSKLGTPIVSTSANISGQPTPTNVQQISPSIKEAVDYVVPLTYDANYVLPGGSQPIAIRPSTILKVGADGIVVTIRA